METEVQLIVEEGAFLVITARLLALVVHALVLDVRSRLFSSRFAAFVRTFVRGACGFFGAIAVTVVVVILSERHRAD